MVFFCVLGFVQLHARAELVANGLGDAGAGADRESLGGALPLHNGLGFHRLGGGVGLSGVRLSGGHRLCGHLGRLVHLREGLEALLAGHGGVVRLDIGHVGIAEDEPRVGLARLHLLGGRVRAIPSRQSQLLEHLARHPRVALDDRIVQRLVDSGVLVHLGNRSLQRTHRRGEVTIEGVHQSLQRNHVVGHLSRWGGGLARDTGSVEGDLQRTAVGAVGAVGTGGLYVWLNQGSMVNVKFLLTRGKSPYIFPLQSGSYGSYIVPRGTSHFLCPLDQ